MGLSMLAGCDSRPKGTAQTTEAAQTAVSAQTTEAAQTTVSALTTEAAQTTAAPEKKYDVEQLLSSPYFSKHEFKVDGQKARQYLLADDFCSALSCSYSDEYLAAVERSDGLEGQGIEYDESGNPVYPDYTIHSCSYACESLSTIDLNAVAPSTDMPYIAAAADDNIAVLSIIQDSLFSEIRGSITVFNSKGEVESRIEEVPFDQPTFFILDFCADGNGNYYILGQSDDRTTSILVVSAAGKRLATYPITDNCPDIMLPAPDGIYTYDRTTDDDGNPKGIVGFVSESQANLEEGIELPEFFDTCTDIFISGDYIYGSDRTTLQAYSMKTKTLEPVLEWKNLDLSFFIAALSINANGAITAIGEDYGTGAYIAAVITPSSTDPNAGKTEIVVGGLQISSDFTVLAAVENYNQSHSDCRIVIRDYDENAVFDSGSYIEDCAKLNQIMQSEIKSSDAPDVWVDIYNDRMGLAAFASDTYLIDLYPYIRNDPEIKADDYFQNVLFGYDTNGKLYLIPSGFHLECLYGNPSVIGADISWTVSDYYSLSEKLGPEKKILANHTKPWLLERALETQTGSFLDLNSGLVSFDSDRFIELLKWSDAYGVDTLPDDEPDPMEVEKNKVAIGITPIGSPVDFCTQYRYMTCIPTYLGYPGSGEEGLPFCSSYVCGITAGCENPDLAWDFVRLFLLDDIQESLYQESGEDYIPVSRDAAAKQIETFVTSRTEDGVNMSAYDDVFWDSYFAVLDRAAVPSAANYAVNCIVFDESETFFAGQITAEETAERIQNRVQVYVDEQMNLVKAGTPIKGQ